MARTPSMKVPPKRKGNNIFCHLALQNLLPSMKVPPKRKGNSFEVSPGIGAFTPSMKVPPKRKGNHPLRLECRRF